MNDTLAARINATLVGKLKQVRDLIATPEQWSQNNNTTDADTYTLPHALGVACRYTDPEDLPSWYYHRLRSMLQEKTGFIQLSVWNDAPDRTHEEVLALLDGLIEELSA